MREMERIVAAGGRSFLLRVETSARAQDYRMYEDLRNEVWGFPEDHMSGTRNMMCENFLHEGGSLFIGAFARDDRSAFPADGAHLAGFCYGFTGVRDKEIGFRDPANLRFYSQFAAVRKGFQGLGLGVRLKEFQGETVRDLLGVGTIICTYDPLTAVNARRNVRHFGMEVLEYRVATYGEYGGRLNRLDVPTDRFLMSWDLSRWAPGGPRAAESVPAAAGQAIRTAVRKVKGRTAEGELEVVEAVEPDRSEGTVIVRIPADFYHMLRETDVEDPEVRRIPLDWRSATRRAFTTLFAAGYGVVDFRRPGPHFPGGEYVLKRKELS
jgi:predicted GNAT superfamily acetyltransferase